MAANLIDAQTRHVQLDPHVPVRHVGPQHNIGHSDEPTYPATIRPPAHDPVTEAKTEDEVRRVSHECDTSDQRSNERALPHDAVKQTNREATKKLGARSATDGTVSNKYT